ncbi:hypothetical protein [Burkholderia cepacia]|uniref:hypothetical protein n=1 Tax=Burkholderia cepacia TaxID=292 RepID=UPI0026E0B36A|nr:hypothetical protein [Burkholderia cepacia]MDO5947158.1 hypothetical protein [Burkholderia cepacia]
MNIEVLKASGFVPVEYQDQQGIFYTKKLPVTDMPYMREHAIDYDLISETTVMLVEVTPDRRVRMTATNTDYLEEAVGIDTDEGAALLRDAGVNVDLLIGKGE